MNDKNYFQEIENNAAFARARVMLVTHPKKSGYARILCAYPKDGAGRLTVYVVDGFGGGGYVTSKGTAGGYGYDKLTAALSGLVIDGHSLTDHCGQDEQSTKLLKAYGRAALTGGDTSKIEARARKLGYSFTNWTSEGGYKPNTWNGYQSCYRLPGLDYLQALGYNIITVL